LTITHLYRRFEGPPVPDRMNASEYFPYLMNQLLAGKVVAISSSAELPAEAARDRESIEYFGVKSIANFPLWVGAGPPFGLVSFHSMREEHTWPAEIVERLQLAAKTFANALVGQDGVVYQKDLGEDTAAQAPRLAEFDPDKSWTAVQAP